MAIIHEENTSKSALVCGDLIKIENDYFICATVSEKGDGAYSIIGLHSGNRYFDSLPTTSDILGELNNLGIDFYILPKGTKITLEQQ